MSKKIEIVVDRFPAIKPFERLVRNLQKENKNIPTPIVVLDYGLTSSGCFNMHDPKNKSNIFINPDKCQENIIRTPLRAEEYTISMVALHEFSHMLTEWNEGLFESFRKLFGNNNTLFFKNTDDNYENLSELLSSYILDEKVIAKYLSYINRQEVYTLFTNIIKPQSYTKEMRLPSNYSRKIDSIIN